MPIVSPFLIISFLNIFLDMLHIINHQNSIANHYIAELRNVNIQGDRLRFRTNIERLGSLMAYEISKKMDYSEKLITTPLAKTKVNLLNDSLVVATILRAGMPFMQGFLNVFDHAEAAFIGASRGAHKPDDSFEIELGYVACPNLDNKILIICDPMLASGKSLVEGCEALLSNGTPKAIHLACIIASPEGIAYIKEKLPSAILWIAAQDEKLNKDSYIVPGLGDAGDLSFGEKL